MTTTRKRRLNESREYLKESLLRNSVALMVCSAVMVSVISMAAIVILARYSSYEASRNKEIGVIVNIAGRQSALSQRIGRLVEIDRIHDKSAESSTHGELERTKLRFETESIWLTEKICNSDFLHRNGLRDALISLYSSRAEILSSLNEILVNQDDNASLVPEEYLKLQKKIDQFQPPMESVVSLVGRTNEDFITSSRIRQIWASLTAMLVSFVSVIVFIVPTIRTFNSNAQNQSQLSGEKERLAMIAARTSNAVIVTDCDGRIEWTNLGFTRISEYSMAEVVGKKPGEFLQFEKTDPAVIGQIRQAIQLRSPITCQIQNRSKSGREYWLELDIQPMIDSTGKHVGFMAVETDITQSKDTEEAILSERKILTVTLDSLTSHVAVLDSQGTIVCINRRWREFAANNGYGDNRFGLGANYLTISESATGSRSEEASMAADGIRSVIRGESKLFELEYPCHSLDEQRWFRLVVTPCDRDGVPNVVVAHENITTRMIAENRLRSNEARMQSIYEGSGDSILVLDGLGFIDCNRRALELFGVESKEQLLGKHLFDYSPLHQPCGGISKELVNQKIQEANQKGLVHFEWLHKRPNGSAFPAEVGLCTFQLEGRPVLQVNVRDISERKETSSYLDMYRSILDQHAIVAETDTTGRIVSVNDAFCRISGYSREELMHQNHRILNSGLHSRLFWQDMFKLVANGGTWHGEICNRAKDGSLYWVNTTIAPLLNHDGKIRGYFALRADITDLKVAQSKAEAACRSKSEFLANMSHEIRTPMTAILGYADLLAEETGQHNDTLRRLEYVETIKRNGEHLLSIINDILDISKIEAEKMGAESIEIDPQQIVEEVLLLMRVKATAKGLILRSDFTTPIPRTIQSDPTRLRQILVNLVGNAIKFTEHGSISLSISFLSDPNPVLRFTVRDTGIGMSIEQTSRLFHAFEQADSSTTRRFGGSGLGLLISKRLAQMLDGDLEVASVYGTGSEFTLTMKTRCYGPLQEVGTEKTSEAKDPQEPTAVSAADLKLANMRILLAEDGPDNQRIISFHLRKAGAVVTIAENGRLAVQLLTTDGSVDGPLISPSPFDLILSDMQMPEMDGYVATRLLRSKGFSLPILALTAHAMVDDAKRCMDAGCDQHLTKPIDRSHLVDACETWGRGAQHVCENGMDLR